jgi:Na+/H+-dicarboxylate symporter
VTTIRPGESADDTYALVKESALAKEEASSLDTILNVFRGTPDKGAAGGMIPRNLFAAATQMNVLGVIFFALLFGAILSTIGDKGKPVLALFVGLNEIVMKMVHLVMYLAPVGIFGLVVAKFVDSGGGDQFWIELKRLGWYAFTVILGLLIHAVVVLPLLLKALGKRSPLPYAAGMGRALLTAFSTASSSATLPMTMDCAKENNQVSEKACSFVLPLGATINMDGTALYEAVAVIFIAQSLGVEMTIWHLIVIFLTATLAAIGAAGIPEAGLVTMVIVLVAVGLDTQGIGTILAIDWFLDRCRTTVNVWGDSVGAAIIDRYEEEEEGGAAPAAVPA